MKTKRTQPTPSPTREGWLLKAAKALEDLFGEAGYTCKNNYAVTCGFPSRGGLSSRRKTVGQCWDGKASEAERSEIFISPVVSDSVEVLDILIHELVHHVVGCAAGHKGPFKRCAGAVGLEGKMTATHAGEKLKVALQGIADDLGMYPHPPFNPKAMRKPEGTRMLKFECESCGWVGRAASKWVATGLPTCSCGGEMFQA